MTNKTSFFFYQQTSCKKLGICCTLMKAEISIFVQQLQLNFSDFCTFVGQQGCHIGFASRDKILHDIVIDFYFSFSVIDLLLLLFISVSFKTFLSFSSFTLTTNQAVKGTNLTLAKLTIPIVSTFPFHEKTVHAQFAFKTSILSWH